MYEISIESQCEDFYFRTNLFLVNNLILVYLNVLHKIAFHRMNLVVHVERMQGKEMCSKI